MTDSGEMRRAPLRGSVLCLGVLALSVQAATINVTTTVDGLVSDGQCSLREAIIAANTDTAAESCPAGSGDDIISVPTGTYGLTVTGSDEDDGSTGDLDIRASVAIQGAGADNTLIDGNAIDRVFHIHGVTVTISGLTIANGDAGSAYGPVGGAILLTGGSNATVSGCTFSGNASGASGGAIYLYAGNTLSVSNSTFVGNQTRTWGGPMGGAICNLGTLTLTNSTFSGNYARNKGGAIYSDGNLTASGCTIAGNNVGFCDTEGCAGAGGGIAVISYFGGNGLADVRNTLVADNTAPTGNDGWLPDCAGTVTSGDYNLIENIGSGANTPACTSVGANSTTDQDPLLGVLQDNGGHTQTFALQPGSPAIDAGDPGSSCPAADQRGIARPQDGNGDGTPRCDIGAYEVMAAVDTTPPAIQSNITGTPGNGGWYVSDVTLGWTVTDPESAISTATGCDSTSVTTDAAAMTFACSATSEGGTSVASVTIMRDVTPPSATASAAPPANAYGWRKQNVTVTFTGTDAISGGVICDPQVVLSSEGADQSASGRCYDAAGNQSELAIATGINIDKTGPTVSISSPADGATYARNQVVLANFTCGDALSGIASCSGTVVNGQPIKTSKKVKNAKFTVNATDKAGNATKQTATYTVN